MTTTPSEVKKAPTLKKAVVDIKINTTDGARIHATLKSDIPGVPKPATPDETIISGVQELARMAALYGDGQKAIEAVTAAVQRVNDWKKENGYA